MNPEHTEALDQVFTEVLEQLAFMFVEPLEIDCPAIPSELVVASMSFRGPVSGQLILTVPRAMAPVLTANVLGMDPDDEAITQVPYDAFKELLNVTCGNVLTAIAGDEPVFDLSVPEIEERPSSAWPDLQTLPGTIRRTVDDYPVLLRMEMSE